MHSLVGKVALVTGGGKGIGRGCALELAKAGATVVIADTDGVAAREARYEMERMGEEKGTYFVYDVFKEEGRVNLVEATLERYEHIDVLVSNPARTVRKNFLNYTLEDFERVIDATLVSGCRLSQLVARDMVDRQERGKIVFISSVHATNPFPDSAPYNMAKAGLEQLARTMAREFLRYHINVNAVRPGWIDTPGERAFKTDSEIKAAAPNLPWGRIGTPEDIGKAVAFLCSDDADYITGTVLQVDGGLCLPK